VNTVQRPDLSPNIPAFLLQERADLRALVCLVDRLGDILEMPLWRPETVSGWLGKGGGRP
jgi:hypothetical protein